MALDVAVPPVFIVGAPRSGTTLLAAMFGSHRDYAAGPESQFFSKLSPQDLAAAIADERWPKRATSLLSSITLAGQPVIELFETSQSAVADFLAARTPSVRAMLEALCVPFADRRHKPGWAEKTPNHILNLPEIRREWPDARIVRIMRDPRDAALSTCKLPTFSDSFAANLYLWRYWQDVGERFLSTDTLSTTIRYESLVAEPEAQLQDMCARIGIDYDPAMLNFANSASDVSSSAETWKRPVGGKLDESRLFAWKKTLSAEDKVLADNVAAEYLSRFDYEADPPVDDSRSAYRLSSTYVERHENAVHRHLRAGTRWLPTDDRISADILLEHPPYRRFRNPVDLVKMTLGRLRFAGLRGVRG